MKGSQVELPRVVASDEFGIGHQTEGCFVACITMLLIYWTKRVGKEYWDVPDDPNSDDWIELGRELFKDTTLGGQETQVAPEKEVRSLLRSRKISKDLKYEGRFVSDLVVDCIELTNAGIPPIFYFDDHKLNTGFESKGRIHSSIFLEKKGSTIKYVDPSSPGSRGHQWMDVDQLLDALSGIPPQVRYLYPKKEITIRPFSPQESLERWGNSKGGD